MDIKAVQNLLERNVEKGILCVVNLRLESIYVKKKKRILISKVHWCKIKI